MTALSVERGIGRGIFSRPGVLYRNMLRRCLEYHLYFCIQPPQGTPAPLELVKSTLVKYNPTGHLIAVVAGDGGKVRLGVTFRGVVGDGVKVWLGVTLGPPAGGRAGRGERPRPQPSLFVPPLPPFVHFSHRGQ